MPLASADPFGGVIITDWYTPPASNGERFKATAYILGRELRSDGVRVAIFRQVLQNGQWLDAPVSPVTVGEIENKVLSRARELREESTGQRLGPGRRSRRITPGCGRPCARRRLRRIQACCNDDNQWPKA